MQTPRLENPTNEQSRAYLRRYRAAERADTMRAPVAEEQFEALTQSAVHDFLFTIRTRERLIETLGGIIMKDNPSFERKVRIHALDAYLRSLSDKEVFRAFSVFEDILLDGGRAIAPAHAANVLTETPRTCTFARGLHDAILELKKRFPNERPLRILYAGTGPFATLALPSMATFSPEEVQFDLLEIQEISLRNARRILKACGFEGHCGQFIEEDAITFKPSPKYHAVITETMGPGLTEEPQVKIMENLADALVEGGIMIPEEIQVGLMLFKSEEDERRFPGLWTWPPHNGETSETIEMHCPFDFEGGEKVIVASYAEISVYGENELALGESVLSMPIGLSTMQRKDTGTGGPQTLHVAYKPGASILWGEKPDLCELR